MPVLRESQSIEADVKMTYEDTEARRGVEGLAQGHMLHDSPIPV